MKQRSITSIFIFLATALAIVVKLLPYQIGDYIFDIFMITIALVAGFEIATIYEKMGKKLNKYLATFYAVFNYAIFIILFEKVSIYNIMLIEFACLVVYFLVILLMVGISEHKEGFKHVLLVAWNTIRSCVYPAFMLCLIVTINHLDYYVAIRHISIAFVTMIFAITMLTDTLAYLVGVTVKGPKLAPKISPNKTISGAVGGLIGGVIGAMLIFVALRFIPAWQGALDFFKLSWWHFLIIGIIGSALGQFGDLFESKLKRMANVKDSGNLFPGHGGMMDRIDAMTIVTIFVYTIIIIII